MGIIWPARSTTDMIFYAASAARKCNTNSSTRPSPISPRSSIVSQESFSGMLLPHTDALTSSCRFSESFKTICPTESRPMWTVLNPSKSPLEWSKAAWYHQLSSPSSSQPSFKSYTMTSHLPQYRMDGKLFSLTHLKRETKRMVQSLLEFQYANNSVTALREDHLQQILNAFHRAYTALGLSINIKKTQILFKPLPSICGDNPPLIKLNGTPLENMGQFCYCWESPVRNHGPQWWNPTASEVCRNTFW